MLGWATGQSELYTFGGADAVTTPATALLLLGLATAVGAGMTRNSRGARAFTLAMATCVGLAAGVLLAQHLFALEPGFESRLWPEAVAATGDRYPGRPSVQTTLGITILTVGQIGGCSGGLRTCRLAALTGLVVGVIAVLGVIGQGLNSVTLYSSAALGAGGLSYPTGVALALLGAAQMANARRHLTALDNGSLRARTTLQRLVPTVIAVPVATAITWGTIQSRPGSAVLGSLVAALGIAVLVFQVWTTAAAVATADRENVDLADVLANGTVYLRGTRIHYTNPAFDEMVGSPRRTLHDRDLDDALGGPLADLRQTIDRLRSAPPGISEEVRLTRPDGTERVVVLAGRPMHDQQSWLGVVQDITERARAQAELAAANAALAAANAALTERLSKQEERLLRYGVVVESSPDAISTETLDGDIRAWNAGAERLYGYTESEAMERQMSMLVPADQQDDSADVLRRVRRGERILGWDTVRLTRSGRRVDVQLTVSPLRSATGEVTGVATIAHDVTPVREQELRFRSVFEATGTALLIVGADGRVQSANRAAVELFGYPAEELVRLGVERLVPEGVRPEHAESRKRFLEEPSTRAMGAGRDLAARRADGSEFPVEVGLSPVTLRAGVSVVVSIVDISDRVRARRLLEAKNADLERSNRELRDFAYVASHDLQEPLRMVVSYTELLAQRYEGQIDDRADRYIGFIVDGGLRMRQLIKGLLVYSRAGTRDVDLKPADVSAIVGNVLRDLRQYIDEAGARVEVGELPAVTADATQLGQLFQNLISNAVKFRGDAPPRIRIEAVEADDGWQFSVADNGIGFDQEFAEQIFMMFRRLHSHGEYDGSGIGLAVVRRIVERHGGRIWCESKAGAGTTFFFTIPGASTDRTPTGRALPVAGDAPQRAADLPGGPAA
ncbi:hypothetical protein GCM10012284_51170 [Mangrovihabitans endophyticus]|uniref:histidine kinase n=1 Tax=Mangrovihabitans endophyticus TaxID=1751298 RepID=A0A8J3C2R1_9ACTN|nr:hypothetical protein GCM10012284_51170 [Mangrovihabitans endophyticus]